jgi:hypothetical protein
MPLEVSMASTVPTWGKHATVSLYVLTVTFYVNCFPYLNMHIQLASKLEFEYVSVCNSEVQLTYYGAVLISIIQIEMFYTKAGAL